MYKLERTKLTECIRPMDNQQKDADASYPIPYKLPSFFYCIVGGRGSGKSTLLMSVLDSPFMRQRYQNIFYCSQTYRNDILSKAPMAELIDELAEEQKVFDDFNEEVAKEIITRIEADNEEWREKPKKKRPKNPPCSLVVIDDCLSSLPRNLLKSVANKLVVNGRHLRVSVICSLQKYTAIPVLWRQNMSCLSLFGNSNKKDIEALLNDTVIDEGDFMNLYRFATDEPRCFLHINYLTTPATFYKRYDKIVSA